MAGALTVEHSPNAPLCAESQEALLKSRLSLLRWRPGALVQQILSFGAGEGIARGLNWGMMAILPFLLDSTTEYGRVGLIVSIEMLVSSVSLLGMDRAVLRFYASDERPERLLRSVLVIWAGIAWIPFAVVLALYIAGVDSFFSIPLAPHLFVLSLTVAISNLNILCIAIGRATGNLSMFLKFRLIFAGCKFFGVILLAILLGRDLSYLLGAGLAAIAMLALIVPTLHKRVASPSHQLSIVPLLIFGWPFVFHILSGNILSYFSRFFLEAYSTPTEVGVFTFAFTLGSGLYVGYAALSTYFEPKIYSHSGNIARCEKWLAFYTNACVSFAATVGAVILFLFPYWSPYLHADYSRSLPTISMVVGTILLNPLYLQGNYRLAAHKKTGYIAIASFISACISLTLNFILIPRYGIWGAAVAMYVANGALCAIIMGTSLKITRVPMRNQHAIPASLICVVASLTALLCANIPVVSIFTLIIVAIISTCLLFNLITSLGKSAR